jgi:hypothetical protein
MYGTAIIANMCDNCEYAISLDGYIGVPDGIVVCLLHVNTLELECVKENKPCPDYKERR